MARPKNVTAAMIAIVTVKMRSVATNISSARAMEIGSSAAPVKKVASARTRGLS